MKKIRKFTLHVIISLLTGWYFVIKSIVISKLAKGAAMLFASILIVIYFINPAFLMFMKYLIPAVYAIGCFLSAARLTFHTAEGTFNAFNGSLNHGEKNINTDSPPAEDVIIENLFAGMNKEAASREYRRLLKIYHPDNPQTGNEQLTRLIIEKYQTMFA